MQPVLDLAGDIAFTYAALLAAYFASCLVLARLDRNSPARKIQRRVEPREQIRRDRRQSILSLASIAAMFGCGQFLNQSLSWGFQANGQGPWQMMLSLAGSLLLFDAWFYWGHRLLHTRRFYARIHRWHHLTMAPEGWSNNSDLIVDNLFLQSYWLVAHFLIPIAPSLLLAHKLYDEITGIVGHSGHERSGLMAWPPSPMVSVTHHDQHHRFVHCNYATHFVLWDRLMGTLHPTHDDELRRNLRR